MNKSGFTIQIQQNAKIKHLFQELLTNKTLIEGDYQGPALIGGNHTWWDGLLKNATFDIQDSQICFFSLPKWSFCVTAYIIGLTLRGENWQDFETEGWKVVSFQLSPLWWNLCTTNNAMEVALKANFFFILMNIQLQITAAVNTNYWKRDHTKLSSLW